MFRDVAVVLDDRFRRLFIGSARLEKLAENRFQQVNSDLRVDIIAFYSNLADPIVTKKNKKHWSRTLAALAALKASK